MWLKVTKRKRAEYEESAASALIWSQFFGMGYGNPRHERGAICEHQHDNLRARISLNACQASHNAERRNVRASELAR